MSEISTTAVIMLALRLVHLTGPDGIAIYINPAEIASLREPRASGERVVHHTAKCLIFTGDGKFIAVQESCAEVRRQIELVEDPPR